MAYSLLCGESTRAPREPAQPQLYIVAKQLPLQGLLADVEPCDADNLRRVGIRMRRVTGWFRESADHLYDSGGCHDRQRGASIDLLPSRLGIHG